MPSEPTPQDILQHTRNNEHEILAGTTCGCLACGSMLSTEEIQDWKDEVEGVESGGRIDRTAICPHCGEALVIGNRSGYQITPTFLEMMRMR